MDNNEEREFILADQTNIERIRVKARKSPILSMIPSCDGFNKQLRNNIPITKSNIGYLDSIDSPATEISTAFEILHRRMKA